MQWDFSFVILSDKEQDFPSEPYMLCINKGEVNRSISKKNYKYYPVMGEQKRISVVTKYSFPCKVTSSSPGNKL